LEEILPLRRKIDEIDRQILRLLSERLNISKKIGRIKKKHKIAVHDHPREDEVYTHIIKEASERGMDASKTKGIYREIIAMCTDIQKNISNAYAPIDH
jgi:chorismate mutase